LHSSAALMWNTTPTRLGDSALQ